MKVAVLLAAALLGIFQARGPLVQVSVVTRSDIQQHLIASGRVRVVTSVQLTAQVAGRVTHSAFKRPTLGSTAASVVERAPRSVLVVRLATA
jgi:hypothetical protein